MIKINLKEKIYIFILFGYFLIKLVLFSLSTPLWQGPDEFGHVGYLEYLVTFKKRLYDNKVFFSSSIEKSINLVGFSTSVLFKNVKKSSVNEINSLRFDFYSKKQSQRKNWIAQHPPFYYIPLTFPFYILAKNFSLFSTVFLLRIFSLILPLLTVFFVYKTINEFTNDVYLKIMIISGVIFHPGFSFISSVIENDNMVIFLGTVLFYLLIKITKTFMKSDTISLKDVFLISLICAFGILSKITFLTSYFFTLIFFAALFFLWIKVVLGERRKEHGSKKKAIKILALSFFFLIFIPALISGWWYVQNIIHLHNWMGVDLSRVNRVNNGKMTIKEFIFEKKFIGIYFDHFWALYGWGAFKLPDQINKVLKFIFIFVLLGLIKRIYNDIALSLKNTKNILNIIKAKYWFYLSIFYSSSYLAAIFIYLYRAANRVGKLRAMHGRYIYPALFPLMLLWTMGIWLLVPDRLKVSSVFKKFFAFWYMCLWILLDTFALYSVFLKGYYF